PEVQPARCRGVAGGTGGMRERFPELPVQERPDGPERKRPTLATAHAMRTMARARRSPKRHAPFGDVGRTCPWVKCPGCVIYSTAVPEPLLIERHHEDS